ncbi:hypothetical protein E4U42_007308 [Claviceps africana]|uniref:Intramembrane protease n=1 Tax=Claviceps africana TaxID=83212 RepID=A0A8K0J168_9HYPO|nr:hypothetical protein E4U42_007308 [Claviceps africana]
MASNATLETGVLDILNTALNGTETQSLPSSHAASSYSPRDFFLLDVRICVVALAIIYLGSHGALRRPPSAAPPRDKNDGQGDDDDDAAAAQSDGFPQGLMLSDAILLPIMAAVTLVGMYYLIQWLQDPAMLNKLLRYYMATVSMVSVLTLYAHAMDLATSLLFPTYWRGSDGSLRKIDQQNQAVALCDAAGNVVVAAEAADSSSPSSSPSSSDPTTNPLPGWLALLAPTQRLRAAAWKLRGVFFQRWKLEFFASGMGELKIQLRFSHMVALLLSVGTALAYFSTESSSLSNLLAYGACYGSFLLLTPTDFLIGSLVLWGLFFYDILMVFYTPYMKTVALTLDVPIKLTFQNGLTKNIIGLGDIVIPGMMIAWALRLDLWLHYVGKIKYESTDLVLIERDATSGQILERRETKHREIKARYMDVRGHWGDDFWSRGVMFLSRSRQLPPHLSGARFAKVYFHAAMAGYALGMAVTMTVLRISKHGQPALLYLVPGVLGAMVATALARGEFKDLWRYTEDGSLDTVDVVVDLDGDGNAIKRIGALENGVVDTTKDEENKGNKGNKDDKEQNKDEEDKGGEKCGEGRGSRRRRVLALSIEAVEA